MEFSSKNPGVSSHSLSPGDLPDAGMEPGSSALWAGIKEDIFKEKTTHQNCQSQITTNTACVCMKLFK